ncbi:hypothetical protein FPZ24_15275 [Sphingomonas panacisoli]|uniref:Uncharacterized protein n=1 Tax=Sphingomonas panacisoli TaxID=1813879 RepID=A0A5B8LL47_9SPHN|nr:hypothetical protein [Sphingomonas panacisoli]QDZ08659.1 hypothetical protein FPZ24_15275 [Sphingomonas panacisoli]
MSHAPYAEPAGRDRRSGQSILTTIALSLVRELGGYSIRQRKLAKLILTAMLAYGGLPAAFILDCCISLPLSLILTLTEER